MPFKGPDIPEIDHLMDLYWGGPERRITGITLRIIGVNAIALILLMLGILYLGQYQNSIIKARLDTFQSELELISLALSHNAVQQQSDAYSFADNTEDIVRRLSLSTHQRIQLFDSSGRLIADSNELTGFPFEQYARFKNRNEQFYSLQVLKELANLVLSLLPDHKTLPRYSDIKSQNAIDFPDTQRALLNNVSLSVWESSDKKIYLTAASALRRDGQTLGTVLLTRESHDIRNAINDVWLNVLKVFAITLALTVLLSIYLSGYIANPLKKLAKAAEMVRKNQISADEIPDFSHRHDEIGELSIIFKQMTSALYERMNMIEQFAADVSHELKNPLTSLKSAVETAAIVKKDKDRKKLLDIIQHDVERLDRLITDISNASRLDAEIAREEFQQIDLKSFMHYFLDSFANPLQREGVSLGTSSENTNWNKTILTEKISITLDCTNEQPLYVWGLESRIAQCLHNILANAVSFSPQNGKIAINVVPLKKRVSIIISDEGPGIPPAKLETIFDRFYSERPANEEYGRHSGLGLSICKHIVEAHGGLIFAENIRSAEGIIKGAQFTLILNRA